MALNYVSEYESDLTSSEALFSETNVVRYIKKISEIRALSAQEEYDCAIEIENGSKEAKKKLIKANLKLVVTVARKFIRTSKLPMIDLIQEGNVGLMVAADKFNRKFGYRFATYAAWWVKQAMFKAISEQSNSVKIPVYIQETLSKYSKVKSEMEKELKKTVTTEEVAKKMKTDAGKLNNYMNAYKKTLSLECDYETGNGSEVRLADIIEDKTERTEAKIEYEALKSDINTVISLLKDREQKVITLRFGLNGTEKQTLEDIGKIYGVTKECIRQTEARALSKLRNSVFLSDLYESYVYTI